MKAYIYIETQTTTLCNTQEVYCLSFNVVYSRTKCHELLSFITANAEALPHFKKHELTRAHQHAPCLRFIYDHV